MIPIPVIASPLWPAPAAGRFLQTRPPRGRVRVEAAWRGQVRVADVDSAQFELFRAVDGDAFDFDSPWETFTSLPHTTAAVAASHDYEFVLRLVNRWGLSSLNIAAWSVTADALGAADPVPPSSPRDVTIEPAAGGELRIRASYDYDADAADDLDATVWLIYLSTDGSDPDTGGAPTTVTMRKADGTAKLDYTTTGESLADFQLAKVIVRVRRVDAGPENVDSTNTDVASAWALATGPPPPSWSAVYHNGSPARQQR